MGLNVPGEIVEDRVWRLDEFVQHTFATAIHQRDAGQLIPFCS